MPRPRRLTEPLAPAEARAKAAEAVELLRNAATEETRVGLLRYGIPNERALGVRVSELHRLAKLLGRSQELCQELWPTGIYEARMLVAFVGEPERLSVAQMDAWCRDFDSWALTDTLCFHLYDRTPLAWECVPRWAERAPEFEKRAAFALIASLARHDDTGDDGLFLDCLPLIEAAAGDPRNFVKKGVSWALRGLGGRNARLLQPAAALAGKLAAAREPSARWIGKDALREFARKRPAKREQPPPGPAARRRPAAPE